MACSSINSMLNFTPTFFTFLWLEKPNYGSPICCLLFQFSALSQNTVVASKASNNTELAINNFLNVLKFSLQAIQLARFSQIINGKLKLNIGILMFHKQILSKAIYNESKNGSLVGRQALTGHLAGTHIQSGTLKSHLRFTSITLFIHLFLSHSHMFHLWVTRSARCPVNAS